MNSSQKLFKIKQLFQNLNQQTFTGDTNIFANWSERPTEIKRQSVGFAHGALSVSQDFSLYSSLVEKPINLLFSLDQFVFEFSKKTYQQKKTGEFFQQLKERKKLTLFYGDLTRKQLLNIVSKVENNKGYFAKNFLSFLERRLDVVIYRSGLTKTIVEARQLIKHQKILVNRKILNVPSAVLNPGDVIEISEKIKSKVCTHLLNDYHIKTKKYSSRFLQSNLEILHENHSKFFCNSFVQEICTRIKLRAYWESNKQFLLSTPTLLSKITLQSENCSLPFILTMFKWKIFSIKKHVSFTKIPSQIKKKQNQLFSNYASGVSEIANFGPQKQPLIWNINLSKIKPGFVNNQSKTVTSSPVYHSDKKHFQSSNLKPLKKVQYKKNFIFFLKHLENSKNSKKFSNLTLFINQCLLKKPHIVSKLSQFRTANSRKFNFRTIRPLNVEISYNTLSLVYLYSPQRINFPFAMNLDLISRSLK